MRAPSAPPDPALASPGVAEDPERALDGVVRPTAPPGDRGTYVIPRARAPASPFRYLDGSPEVIRYAVLTYVRFPWSSWNV